MLSPGSYDQMLGEIKDLVEIWTDDTANKEQTMQMITEGAQAAISVQGLSVLEDKKDKLMVVGAMLASIAEDFLKQGVVGTPEEPIT